MRLCSLSVLGVGLLLGCGADVASLSEDGESGGGGELTTSPLPFTPTQVALRGDLAEWYAATWTDADLVSSGKPFVGWRLVKSVGAPDSFMVTAVHYPNAGETVSVDPEAWLLDERFQLIAHSDDAWAGNTGALVSASWGQHATLYLVARNKTPTSISFQRPLAAFNVSFTRRDAVPPDSYALNGAQGVPIVTPVTAGLPDSVLKSLQLNADGSWAAVLSSTSLSGPRYGFVANNANPGTLYLYGVDFKARTFTVQLDRGVMHVTYFYRNPADSRLTMKATYDLVGTNFRSPLPYGRRQADGAMWVPDHAQASGWRMLYFGATLLVTFAPPALDGSVAATVQGPPTYNSPMTTPVTVTLKASGTGFVGEGKDRYGVPYVLQVASGPFGSTVVLDQYTTTGVSITRRFEGTLAP